MGLINKTVLFVLLILFVAFCTTSYSGVITRLPTEEKVVALTFDACPTREPQRFDREILDYLIREKIPSTLFISGWFARSNAEEIKRIAALDFIEIEYHSANHHNNMEGLSGQKFMREIDDSYLAGLIGRKTKFFRFPAGNYDEKTLALVEQRYKVVHWTFESGDPNSSLTPGRLKARVLAKTGPGSILIFHINGKGYSTGSALTEIVKGLKKRGYRFVKLEEMIG